MEEIWKTIEIAPNYEVSNLGRVRNRIRKSLSSTGKHLKARFSNKLNQIVVFENI